MLCMSITFLVGCGEEVTPEKVGDLFSDESQEETESYYENESQEETQTNIFRRCY